MQARNLLKNELTSYRMVEVDMGRVVLTPSFADEFLGVLLVEISEMTFRSSIRIVNIQGASRILLQKVLARRASRPLADASAHNPIRAAITH